MKKNNIILFTLFLLLTTFFYNCGNNDSCDISLVYNPIRNRIDTECDRFIDVSVSIYDLKQKNYNSSFRFKGIKDCKYFSFDDWKDSFILINEKRDVSFSKFYPNCRYEIDTRVHMHRPGGFLSLTTDEYGTVVTVDYYRK